MRKRPGITNRALTSTMEKHPHFDLWLHTNSELELYIDGPVYERVTLHEWPLSCVQRLVHYDGRRFIYKAQSGPTVEAEFYASAQSSLLVKARTLFRDARYACLLLENLDARRLDSLSLLEEEALEAGQDLLGQIAHIQGNYPYYFDISSVDKWIDLVEGTSALLEALVDRKVFHGIDYKKIGEMRNWMLTAKLFSLFEQPAGLVHGDFSADNIFYTANGYRVIDWQRPLFGPAELDMAALLESLGFDPGRYVSEAVLKVRKFLNIRWYAECADRWFPPGKETYDRMVKELADTLM